MRTSRTRMLAPLIILGAVAGLSACVPSADDSKGTDDTLSTLATAAPFVTSTSPSTTSTLLVTSSTISSVITAGTATLPSVDPNDTEADDSGATVGGSATTSQSQATTTTAKRQAPTTTSETGPSDYTIVAGDYLKKIADRCGIGPTELANYNDWSDGSAHAIFPGQKIKLPCVPSGDGGTTATTVAGGDSGASTTTPSGATTTTVAAGPGGTYTVKAGDYLSGIAAKTGTTVDAIVEANGWTDGASHVIVPGQVIKMPAKAG